MIVFSCQKQGIEYHISENNCIFSMCRQVRQTDTTVLNLVISPEVEGGHIHLIDVTVL